MTDSQNAKPSSQSVVFGRSDDGTISIRGELPRVVRISDALLRQMVEDLNRLNGLVRDATPFVAAAYRGGGVVTFPNSGDWLERASV